ncbi:hypothetical protein [Burkholderia sp. JP2-270]|uniref:hypothetical protein n=1 Tax=Burkholderia sp. JP2-270 TaxID=2217913 RepID=UPI0013A6B82F|nr:hypothetical protein [Burkholderia sp. JP2-270]
MQATNNHEVGEIMSKIISAVTRLLSRITAPFTAPVTHPLMPTARLRTVEIRCADTVRTVTRRRDASIR